MEIATGTAPTLPPEYEKLLATWKQERRPALDEGSLLALLLVPVWTRTLADRCRFPHEGSWDDFLARAQAAGLAEQGEAVAADDEADAGLRTFWMPATARPQAKEQLTTSTGRDVLAGRAVELALIIRQQEPGDPAVPAIGRCWAELAAALEQPAATKGLNRAVGLRGADTGRAARLLSERVARLVGAPPPGQAPSPGEARLWIEAGEALALALGGELTGGVILAKRQIELANRADVDQRYLRQFVERPEQLAAFHALMNGPDERWALHYLGMGGVGKTMLLRHIAYLTPGARYNSPIGRVDFDRLSPDYPVRHPGQLLLALAEDLRSQFSTEQHQTTYLALRNRLLFLHEVIGGETPPGDPLANLHRQEFEQALILFDALLKALLKPGEPAAAGSDPAPHVVLMLDTCEELVKPESEAGLVELPHLAATFEILERVHKRAPEVRVILAGRRLLARRGDDWQTATERLPEVKSSLPPEKPYLRLHLMRGFDGSEAAQLLARYATPERPFPADIRQAILEASADPGTPATVRAGDGRPWLLPPELYGLLLSALDRERIDRRLQALQSHAVLGPALRSLPGQEAPALVEYLLEMGDRDGRNLLVLLLRELATGDRSAGYAGLADQVQALLTRYSPFSLALYSQWYADSPELTADDIRGGGDDPYVHLRIVGRITDDRLRRLLPAAVLLRRFNEDMLAPVFAGDRSELARVFRGLSDFEWLDYRRDPETDAVWIEVEPNLYPRLLAYYEHTMPGPLAELGRKLSAGLADGVRRDDLRRQRAESIAACLALLPAVDAVQLWSEVEWRVPVEADWSWALKVARLAAGAEADAGRPERPLLAAALAATQAAAGLHLVPTYDAAPAWRGVAAQLARLEAEEAAAPVAAWLLARAKLGEVAATPAGRSGLDAEVIADVSALLGPPAGDVPPRARPTGPQVAQLYPALLAALEAITDDAEESSGADPLPDDFMKRYAALLDMIGGLAGSGAARGEAAPLRAARDSSQETSVYWHSFARLLEGRLLALAGQHEPAGKALTEAWQLAAADAGRSSQSARWADWRAPASLLDRVRLEWLRLRFDLPAAEPPDAPAEAQAQVLERWLDELIDHKALNHSDGERLASAALARRLDQETAGAELLAKLEPAYVYSAARRPICLAHRQTPPLFLTLARGWLALGDAARGEQLLLATQREATRSGTDAVSVAATERGLIEIARRTRDAERATALIAGQASLGWPEPDAWVMAPLTGALKTEQLPAPDAAWDAARLHAWWRAQYGSSYIAGSPGAALVVERARNGGPPAAQDPSTRAVLAGPTRPADGYLLLDAEEYSALTSRYGQEPLPLTRILPGLSQTPADQQAPAHAEETLRLLLRWCAQDGGRGAGQPEAADGVQPGWFGPEPGRAPTPLIERLTPGPVGVRRAAEIALDEGEVLALRLPAAAAPLLARAYTWFWHAGDPVGLTQAAILRTLTLLRAGQLDEAAASLAECETAYRNLTAARPGDGLPEWEVFRDSLRTANPGLRAAVAPAWRGWLTRLTLPLVWDAGSATHPAETYEALLARVGALNLGPLPPEMLVAQSRAESASPPPPRASSTSTLTLTALIGVLLLAGVLVGLYFGFRALVLRLAPASFRAASISTTLMVGLYAAFLVASGFALSASRSLRRSIRTRLAAAARIQYDIGTPVGQAAGLKLSFSERQWGWWPPKLSWREGRGIETSLGLPIGGAAEAYSAAAGAIAVLPAVKRVAQLETKAGGRGVTVALDVAPELAGQPWEAWLGLGIAQAAKKAAAVRFYRTATRGPAGPFTPGGVSLVTGETWAGLFEPAWKLGGRAAPGVGPGAYHLRPDDELAVMHVVGRPAMTRGGPRLQIEAGDAVAGSYDQTAAVRSAGEFLGPDDLAQPALRRAGRLVVLQALPSEEVQGRAVARDDAVTLRQLAAQVFAAGVPTVVVLPALPARLAESAAARLAQTFYGLPRDPARERRAWLAAVERIRADVNGWRTGGDTAPDEQHTAALAELAWDITLFSREVTEVAVA